MNYINTSSAIVIFNTVQSFNNYVPGTCKTCLIVPLLDHLDGSFTFNQPMQECIKLLTH